MSLETLRVLHLLDDAVDEAVKDLDDLDAALAAFREELATASVASLLDDN